jgi:hypothetical protein
MATNISTITINASLQKVRLLSEVEVRLLSEVEVRLLSEVEVRLPSEVEAFAPKLLSLIFICNASSNFHVVSPKI